MRCALIFISWFVGVLAPIQAWAMIYSGWWWDPALAGTGFSIEQQENTLFIAGYIYDSKGNAIWLAAGPAALNGKIFTAPLNSYGNGQTLTGAYRPASVTGTVGTLTVQFTNANNAILTWPGGTIPIQRFDIVTGGSAAPPPVGAPERGWWWNPAEGGRGYFLEIQNNVMFAAAYMYDISGNPVWYVSGPTAMTDAMTYIGTWVQYGNGPTLSGPYKAATIINPNVGGLTIQFTDTQTGILTLPGGQRIPIQKYWFGFSFAPFPITVPYPGDNLSGCHDDHTGDDVVQAAQLQAWGGAPVDNYSWTVASDSALPPGTMVDEVSGVFQGNGAGVVATPYPYVEFYLVVSDGTRSAMGRFAYVGTELTLPTPPVPPDYVYPVCGALSTNVNNPLNINNLTTLYQPSVPSTQNFLITSIGQPIGFIPVVYGGTPPYSWTPSTGAGGNVGPETGLYANGETGLIYGVPLASAGGSTLDISFAVGDNTGDVATCLLFETITPGPCPIYSITVLPYTVPSSMASGARPIVRIH